MTDPVKAFAAHLASITDDAARARELARAKMLAMQQAPEEAFEAPIRSLGDYLDMEIEIPPVLVQPFLVVRGGVNATIGRAGKGKTVMNLNRILRWAAGKPLFDGWVDREGNKQLAPDGPLRILVVENEGAAGMFHRQVGIMAHATEFLDAEAQKLVKENVLVWGEGGYSGLKLDDQNKLNGLRAGVEKWEPDIVYIEPFRSLWKGEENSATEMNVVADALVDLATAYECAVIIAHHERKSGTGEDSQEKMNAARGSTVLEGVVTAMENFEAVKGGEYRELSWSKSRHGPPPNPVRMEWVPEAWWYRWVPSSQLDEAIMRALRESPEALTVQALRELTDESESKVRRAVTRLKDEGKIKAGKSEATGRGSTGVTYRLPTDELESNGGLAI